MKCYNHPERNAIGVCKSCLKGICMDCSTTIGRSLACKNSCEEDVAALNYMIERGRKVYKNLGSQWTSTVVINGIGGAFFLGFGFFNADRPASWLLIGLGAIMLTGGLLSFIHARKIADGNQASK